MRALILAGLLLLSTGVAAAQQGADLTDDTVSLTLGEDTYDLDAGVPLTACVTEVHETLDGKRVRLLVLVQSVDGVYPLGAFETELVGPYSEAGLRDCLPLGAR